MRDLLSNLLIVYPRGKEIEVVYSAYESIPVRQWVWELLQSEAANPPGDWEDLIPTYFLVKEITCYSMWWHLVNTEEYDGVNPDSITIQVLPDWLCPVLDTCLPPEIKIKTFILPMEDTKNDQRPMAKLALQSLLEETDKYRRNLT